MTPAFLAAGIALGGCIVCLLTVAAAVRFRLRKAPRAAAGAARPGISVLKAVAGDEPDLERNLRSFFDLDYPRYELLFAARKTDDPALEAARRLSRRYPRVPVKILAVGEPPYPNAKVFSLQAMAAAARYDLLVVSDSDIRVEADCLDGIAAEFSAAKKGAETGVATCPYRAVPGPSFWSLLEALNANGEFWGGVLLAEMPAPMDFAVGPTMAVSRDCLEAVGGFEAFREYLAEDFVLGKKARAAGFDVRLARNVVEHRIGADRFAANFRHRLRWNRSTRRSRPWGYIGQIFMNPLPWALLAVPLSGAAAWSLRLLGVCAVLRAAALFAVGLLALGDRLALRRFWLIPLQDTAALLFWFGAFFGNTVEWRGRRFRLTADGKLRPLARRSAGA